MKLKSRILIAVLLVISLLTLVACDAPGKEPNPTVNLQESDKEEKPDDKKVDDKKELRDVTVVLDYVINTNHSGLYLAKERGFYEEEGLNVEIIEPQEGVTLQILATGKADFGVSYQEDLTYALTNDDPLPLKAIAAVIQNNTSGFVSLKSKNIKETKDIAGKVYAGWGSPAEQAIIQAAVKQAGEDPDSVEFVTAYDTSYASLQGDVDLMWFFEGWDIIAAEMEGLELNYIPCKDIDERLNYYTPIIVTRDELIEDENDYVTSFMRATKKGYEEASKEENVEEICDILLKYSPELNRELLIKSQYFLAKEYAKGADSWGIMKPEVWQNYADFMQEHDLIEKVLDPDAYFTNEFILDE